MQQGKEIPDFKGIDFIFDDDLEFSINTEYGPIIESRPTTLLTLLSNSIQIGGFNIPSGQFALQSFQVWQTTEPLEFDLSLKMYVNTDSGHYDITVPAFKLMEYAVPSKSTNRKGQPGQGLIPPGPNIQDILRVSGLLNTPVLGSALQAGLNNSVISSRKRTNGGLIDIQIGQYWLFQNCVLTSAKPTFSEAKDTDYAPVSADVSISFRTSEVATTNMLEEILQAAGKRGSLPAKNRK